MHALGCRRGPPVPLAALALACVCTLGTPPARAASIDASTAASAELSAPPAVAPAEPPALAAPAAPAVIAAAAAPQAVPQPAQQPVTPLAPPPAAPLVIVPLVIVPRQFDETALVKVDSEGMPDGWPLAEVTPSQENQPTLPEAIVTHVQAPQERHTELSLAYSTAHLTHGYGNWYGVHLRGLYQAGGRTVIGELSQLRRFGETTQLGAITYVQDMGPDWFGGIGFAGTTTGTILPSARVDLSINRKLLSNRSLVLSAGAGYAWNRNGHRDQLYHLGAIWYALPKWIFEAGWNYTVDSPGSVKAPAYYGALTYGEVGKSVIVLRGGFGREAYQAIGNNAQITDFRSHEMSLKWRYWITRKWGTQVEFDYYHNPFYSRFGGEVGVFYRW